MPGSRFIVIEAELVLGGLKAVFDRPAMSFDGDQLLDGRSGGTPGGEVGEFAIDDMASDQQAARPQAAVFRRGVSTTIGKGVPSFQLNEINGLKGTP